jgi:hypothetical protein
MLDLGSYPLHSVVDMFIFDLTNRLRYDSDIGVSANRFAWSPTRWLGTHNPLVAGSSPARRTSDPTWLKLVHTVGLTSDTGCRWQLLWRGCAVVRSDARPEPRCNRRWQVAVLDSAGRDSSLPLVIQFALAT